MNAQDRMLHDVRNMIRPADGVFADHNSKSRDRVIQYPIHLVQGEGTTVIERNSPWLDHLMLEKPIAPGRWKWQYQYHVGGLRHY
jgi:hypothetical protein